MSNSADIPHSHYTQLIDALKKTRLKRWANQLESQLPSALSAEKNRDVEHWLTRINHLPSIHASHHDLQKEVAIGNDGDIEPADRDQLIQTLRGLMPWRKGPWNLFGIHVDTEWRSDLKWSRLRPHITNLAGRTVLDVGCGNGYYALRMHGAGAERVVGIDPSLRFVFQFYLMKHFIAIHGETPVDVLPLGIQDLPENLAAFDTVFSMGVLYHRRSPLDHLLQLRDALRPGGQVVVETLVVEGPAGFSLVPEDRYAQMRNVWFLPSVATLTRWMKKCGFVDVRCVDTSVTTIHEQRATEWIESHSLERFLDPNNPNKTIEGYPAPTRAIIIAERKS